METNTKPFGKRVLVEKERLDAGGMRLTPTQEEDGQKNTGKIVAVGQVGWLARLRGIRVGATIHFKKFFVCNDGQVDSLVFVDLDAVTGIDI
jgi:co-chaperonin GroES (HSP10)